MSDDPQPKPVTPAITSAVTNLQVNKLVTGTMLEARVEALEQQQKKLDINLDILFKLIHARLDALEARNGHNDTIVKELSNSISELTKKSDTQMENILSVLGNLNVSTTNIRQDVSNLKTVFNNHIHTFTGYKGRGFLAVKLPEFQGLIQVLLADTLGAEAVTITGKPEQAKP